MKKEIKVVKNRPDFDMEDDSEKVKEQLDIALSEYKNIKKMMVYLFIGLFIIFIIQTILLGKMGI